MSKKPTVLMILDGYGLNDRHDGNAVYEAKTPVMDGLMKDYPFVKGNASGLAVGLPDGQMGNSEVGHMNMGAGRIVYQELTRITKEIQDGDFFKNEALLSAMKNAKDNDSAIHFMGLLSDGGVHSHNTHLYGLLEMAKREGLKKVYVHCFLDGRDTPPASGKEFVEQLEAKMKEIGVGEIGVISGRYYAMDRDNRWDRVELAYKALTQGEGVKGTDAAAAVQASYDDDKTDEFVLPTVIEKDGKPVATISDKDSVVFFNFRGDRAIEISKAFEGGADFDKFDRVRVPKVVYSGMLEYDGDLHIPTRYLVSPPEITNTMGEYLADMKISQYAISETQKYGHVTYFWNGNRSGKFSEEYETYVEVPSDIVPFEQRPWMKCAEITDKLIEALESGKYDCIRVNFPNGDMVGHTGSLEATICSMEALDLQLGRILPVVDKVGGVAIITADHGNADEMAEFDKKTHQVKHNPDGSLKAKTSHTLNPVPCIIYDNKFADTYTVKKDGKFGLSNVAATVVNLLGYEAPEMWDESMIER